MAIVQHDFQGKTISQTSEETLIANTVVPKGYVNLTDMCKANGKKLGHYLKLHSTKSLITDLCNSYTTTEEKLLIIIRGSFRGDSSLQGTWGIKEIAKNLASWLEASTARQGSNHFEATIQLRLGLSLKGDMEVKTPVGNIDVLTSTQIIEIKDAKSWKCALGQVIAYGHYYPSHKKRIHFFNKEYSQSKSIIEDICKKQDVIVTWE